MADGAIREAEPRAWGSASVLDTTGWRHSELISGYSFVDGCPIVPTICGVSPTFTFSPQWLHGLITGAMFAAGGGFLF